MQSNVPEQNFFPDGDPVDDYLNHMADTLGKISRRQIWEVIEVLFQAWRERRRVFVCGNGGSSATASHMANDLNKFTIVNGKPRMKAMALTENVPLMTAWGNDVAYENIFVEQLLNFVEPGDVVVAISASGNSPNILRAVETAQEHQAITVAFTGNDGGKLKQIVHYCIHIPDDYTGRQEDGHLILDHLIAKTLRDMIANHNETSI
jgi:D-sedoheptulose 7-phosphate isomerase